MCTKLCTCLLSFLATTYLWVFFWLSHLLILVVQVIYIMLLFWLIPCFPTTFYKGLGRLHHLSTVVLIATNPFWSVKTIRQSGKSPIIPRGCIIMVNHLSYVDTWVMSQAMFPRHVQVIAQGLVFKIPILGQVMYLSGHIPVWFYKDKEGKWRVKGKDKLIQRSQDVVKHNRRLLVYPEGTLSKTGELKDFKIGFFNVAKETGGAIAAAYPGKVEITFGDAIDPDNFEETEQLRDHVRDTIAALQRTLPSYRKDFQLDKVHRQPAGVAV